MGLHLFTRRICMAALIHAMSILIPAQSKTSSSSSLEIVWLFSMWHDSWQLDWLFRSRSSLSSTWLGLSASSLSTAWLGMHVTLVCNSDRLLTFGSSSFCTWLGVGSLLSISWRSRDSCLGNGNGLDFDVDLHDSSSEDGKSVQSTKNYVLINHWYYFNNMTQALGCGHLSVFGPITITIII